MALSRITSQSAMIELGSMSPNSKSPQTNTNEPGAEGDGHTTTIPTGANKDLELPDLPISNDEMNNGNNMNMMNMSMMNMNMNMNMMNNMNYYQQNINNAVTPKTPNGDIDPYGDDSDEDTDDNYNENGQNMYMKPPKTQSA